MRARAARRARVRDRGAHRLHLPQARRHRARLPQHRRRRRQRDHPSLRREQRAAAGAASCCSSTPAARSRASPPTSPAPSRSAARFSPAQRRLYEAVLETQMAAIEAVKPGATHGSDPRAGRRVADAAQLVELGILQRRRRRRWSRRGAYKPFYMHRTSHWLGMDVHDVGFYSERRGAPARAGHGADHRARALHRRGRRARRPSFAASACASRTTSWSPATGYDNLTSETPKSRSPTSSELTVLREQGPGSRAASAVR